MVNEIGLERDILRVIDGCDWRQPVIEPSRLFSDGVNNINPGAYKLEEFNRCLRRMAAGGLIDTPQQLKPLLTGGGLTGTISTQLPAAGCNRLNELMDNRLAFGEH